MVNIKKLFEENGDLFYPVTHIDAVRDEEGHTVRDLISEGGVIPAANVAEAGLYFVDDDLNIGVYIDTYGIHGQNILEHQIVEQ